MTTAPRAANAKCRSAKWKLEKPLRTATAGLAASDSTIPAPVSTSSAVSKARSIVNHHSASRLLSAREKIMGPDIQSPR